MSGSAKPERLVAVDAFRGMTILAMILANNPGDFGAVYWPLAHAEWHGCTPTDLIFPFFLFIVGVSVVLALQWRLDAGAARGPLTGKVFRRSAILFAMGLFLSGYPFGFFGPRSLERLLETWRIAGVLQRIAVCYLLVSLLLLFCRRRILRWTAAVCLFGYWFLMTAVPVPGHGAPDLDDKGAHLAGWIDRTVLGNHIWSYGKVYDPEGILSTIPALATTLFGVFAGWLLVSKLARVEKVARLLVRGVMLTAAGYVWSWFFPFNKALWTSSYAVFTAGLATCGLALCLWAFDVRRHRAWAQPFVVYGLNAILVFVGSGGVARTLAYVKVDGTSAKTLIYETLFVSWLPPYVASLGYAIAWVLAWYVLLAWLYRRGWFLKI